jgi:transposase-like protein
MNKKELEVFRQAAAGIKSEQDLIDFRRISSKITVEVVSNAELETPCDREGNFEPKIVKKNQTRLPQLTIKFYICVQKA